MVFVFWRRVAEYIDIFADIYTDSWPARWFYSILFHCRRGRHWTQINSVPSCCRNHISADDVFLLGFFDIYPIVNINTCICGSGNRIFSDRCPPGVFRTDSQIGKRRGIFYLNTVIIQSSWIWKSHANPIAISCNTVIFHCNTFYWINSLRNHTTVSFHIISQHIDAAAYPCISSDAGSLRQADIIPCYPDIPVCACSRSSIIPLRLMSIFQVYSRNFNTRPHIYHSIIFCYRIFIIKKFYTAFLYIMECIVSDSNPFVSLSCHHAVGSQPCKNILKHIILNNKIFTGSSIIRLILWKNIILICTAVYLNTFLTAFYIILIISAKCTSCDPGIFNTSKFQKMRFQIIKKCSIFDSNISSMADAETHKTSWCIFFFYNLIIEIPCSSINNYISITIVTAFWFQRISQAEQNMFIYRGLGNRSSLCI